MKRLVFSEEKESVEARKMMVAQRRAGHHARSHPEIMCLGGTR